MVDCDSCLEIQSNHAKAIFRKSEALSSLHCYKDSLNCLMIFATMSEQKLPKEEIKRKVKILKTRIAESVCGTFDDIDACRSGEHAEFFSTALEVRISPGKGRGVFAKRKIEQHELLVVEKPFAFAITDEIHDSHELRLPTFNLNKRAVLSSSLMALIPSILEKVRLSKAASARLAILYDGNGPKE